MDAQVAQSWLFSEYEARYEAPFCCHYTAGPHNTSVNGGKLYERTRIKALAEERERIQKKTFTKWSNTFLQCDQRLIGDLFTDLCDGRILLKLIERVSGYKLPPPTPGRMRIHCLENVEKSLVFLDKLNVHLENIGAHDIVDGNSRIILGLIWTIILRFQVQNISVIEKVRRAGHEEPIGLRRNSTEALLLWCKAKTQGYPNVAVTNFTKSWRDGLAFNALIHKHRPDLVDYSSLSPDEPLRNLQIAFTTAERCLGIPKLLDPEDIMIEEPEEKSIITYLVLYYHYFARIKANTVQTRRIERVIGLLRNFISDVKNYELCAENLLKWIHKSINRMNDRAFQRNIESLQLQLVEFNNFRIEEKPPHFHEKGDLEVAYFVIMSEMVAAGMRIYLPPKRLKLSEINKAWDDLERSEHTRWLDINDELRKQEMLEQLFHKFEIKCCMRESWLQENQKIAEQEIVGSTQYTLQVALKKHEALESDVFAYEDRIEMLVQIANELEYCGYFRAEDVSSRCSHVMTLWNHLIETLDNRRLAIQKRIFDIGWDNETTQLMASASDLKMKIERIDPGSNLDQAQHAMMSVEIVENEWKTLSVHYEYLLKRHTNGNGDDLKKQWLGMADQFANAVEKKRAEMEKLAQHWRLLRDLSRHKKYAQDRIHLLLAIGFELSYNEVTRTHRKVRLIEEDLAVQQEHLGLIKYAGDGMKNDPQISEFIELWDIFNQLLSFIKSKAIFLEELIFLNCEMDGALNWVSEKTNWMQLEDGCSLDSSLRSNQRLLEEVEAYRHTIEHISDVAATLKKDYKDFDFTPRSLSGLLSETATMRSMANLRTEIESILTQKSARVFHVYYSLAENTRRRQASLIDAISVQQFLQNVSQARDWISEKSKLLNRLKPTDLRIILEKGLSSEIEEEFGFVERQFKEIELEMNLMAEQVTNINTSASNLVDIVATGTIQNSNEVLSQVTEAQNKLNDAWNQLADDVEGRRYLLNLDHAFLALCQDCSCTAEWIEDKLSILSRNTWNDLSSLTQLTRLECTLSSLQSDARVIRAKVDNICEQVLATYTVDEAPSSERRKWLLEAHDGLCGRLAELERHLDQLKNLVSIYWGQLTSAQSLEDFFQWLSFFKTKRCCITITSDLEEARRLLSEQEQDLQELTEAGKHLGQLLTGYEKPIHSGSSSAVVDKSRVDSEQVLEEYTGTCDLVRGNIAALQQIIAMQALMAEAGSLEVAIRQQDAYLLRDDQLNSVEAVEAALREHEAFVTLMSNCCNRLSLLESKSQNIAANQRDNEGRLTSKLRSLREKVEKNKKKTFERERALKENLRLQELLGDSMDIEDWIADKSVALKQLTITSKRDIIRAYNQVRALQDEIEASRGRAEHIIGVGKQIINSSPQFGHIVSLLINDIVAHWEGLLQELHGQMRNLEESHREYTMNEAVQNLMNWANKIICEVKANMEDSTLTTAGLSELQRRLESHQKDCQDFEGYLEAAGTIKDHSDALSRIFPSRSCDFSAVNIEVSKQLNSVDAALGHREGLLNFHSAIARHLLDLTSELLWAKDKLVQIRQPYTDWKPQERRSAGRQLLRVRQAKRRLMNHIAEVENRGPRVKHLCEMMKEEYLQHTETAGPRIGRFRDILRELEQAWYTITYLLEVRREELRLADAIHKFCFDVINIEAWISERELYLQGLHEPTNIEEAHRALRRLNVLQETVAHWSYEVVQTERRGNELCQELSSTVQINGEYVAAPPVAITTVLEATKEVVVAFEHLKSSVLERQRNLTESITLHDIMQDINDLEEWIASRQKTANSHELGDDLEHSFYLHDRFSQFAKSTQIEGARRLKAMLFRIDQLIARGHRNRNEVALGKDHLNEGWADLIELIDTRKQLLNSSITMHRFFSDTQCLETQIHDCYQHIPMEPTIDMVMGRDSPNVKANGGIASLQRKHVAMQLLLEHIRTCCARMTSMAGRLLPQYAGEQEKQLLTRRDCVLEAARQLTAEAERRSRQLDEAQRLHKFFITAQSLLDWLAEKKENMSRPDALSRTIYGVERLVADHRQLFAELGIKVKQIDECLDTGRAILTAPESPFGVSRLYEDLAGPQGKLRETCVLLATERVITEALWRERWERLAMLLDSRYFLRDAAAAESWLNSREVYLVSVRRSIGETLAETLALLGAHYAFEKACVSAEEKFAALKRLTKLEIHALEWKPEDAKRYEKQKRENIRRAVHEFLPPSDTYTRPPVSKKDQTTRLIRSSLGSRDPIMLGEKPIEMPPLALQGTRPPLGVPLSSERTLPIMRTVPLPAKCTSRASLPLVTVAKQRIVEEEHVLRPSSSTTTRGTSPRTPPDDLALMPQPSQDVEEGKTIETTSSTRPQGSFPSTTAHTPPLGRKAAVPEDDATLIGTTVTTERSPRVEGPLVRKWELDDGGERHARGRGWTSTYVTLLDGKLTFYKDRRTCHEQKDETLRGEPAIDLMGAVALPALDYTKRPFVFRLKLNTGAEYLLQAVNREVLQRWVDAINDTASKLAAKDLAQLPERARSHSATSHESRISSGNQQRQQKRPHSSFRRILKRS